MFTVKQVVTGLRPQGTTDAILEVTPTKGSFRLNVHAASALGVTKGEYVEIVEGDGDYAGQYAITKAADGSKLAFASEDAKGGKLQFSAAAPYELLGGTPEGTSTYKLNSVGEGYFTLEKVGFEAKAPRKKGAKKVDVVLQEDAELTEVAFGSL